VSGVIRDRYEVRPTTSGTSFVIHDYTLSASCGLDGCVLAWRSRGEADRWLEHCYDAWGLNPADGEEPPRVSPRTSPRPRRRWRKIPQTESPWAQYTTPPEPWEIPYQR
jgi:hypothetical protein